MVSCVLFAAPPPSAAMHRPLRLKSSSTFLSPLTASNSFVLPLRPVTRHHLPNASPASQPTMIALPPALTGVSSLVNRRVLSTSVSAIAKLLITLALGVTAASRGLLDASTLTALSKVVYNLFLPSLLFTNIVQTLSSPLAPGLPFMPLAAIAQVAIGLVIGKLGSKLLGLTEAESRIYLVSTAFGNSAALPLLFASSLFAGTAALPQLVASLSFFLLGWTGLFWSLAYALLTSPLSTDASTQKSEASPKKAPLAVFIKRVATPPLVASLAALFIGLFRPVRTALIASPLFPALSTLAAGYAPAAVLILAGSLARARSNSTQKKQDSMGERNVESPLRITRMVAGISFSRFLLMPLIAFAMVRLGPFRSPFVALAVLLEGVMPSAQNSTLILNLENRPDAAGSVATILLAVYLIGVLPISIALTLFLGYTGV